MTTTIYEDLAKNINRSYGNTIDVLTAFRNMQIGVSKRAQAYSFFTQIVKTPQEVIDFINMWDDSFYTGNSLPFKEFAQDVYIEIASPHDETVTEMLKICPNPKMLLSKLSEKTDLSMEEYCRFYDINKL